MTTPTEPPAGGGDPQYGGGPQYTPPPGGQPPQYGQPQYGQPQYGQPQYGQPQYGGPPGYGQAYAGAPMGGGVPPLANWGERVLGALVDYVAPFFVGAIFVGLGHGLQIIGALIYLAGLAWAIYNAYLGGQTGQSYGKKMVGIRLISEQTGQPIGGGLGIGRYFLHILDGLVCDIGYLWPLWDRKNQTFADKLVHTVVVKD
jgi:uncharacterized RDD family membrane protein YckC